MFISQRLLLAVTALVSALVGCSGTTDSDQTQLLSDAALAETGPSDASADGNVDSTPDSSVNEGGLIDCSEDASACPADQLCKVYCGSGWCSGVCLPVSDCTEDAAVCLPDQTCVEHCTDGWCAGLCESKSDA
jgi:hypothetical protein